MKSEKGAGKMDGIILLNKDYVKGKDSSEKSGKDKNKLKNKNTDKRKKCYFL